MFEHDLDIFQHCADHDKCHVMACTTSRNRMKIPVQVCPKFFATFFFLYTLHYAICGVDPWYVWIVWKHKVGRGEIENANGLFILPVWCYTWIPYLDFVSLTYWAQTLSEGFQHLSCLLCINFLYLAYSQTHWLVQRGNICQSRERETLPSVVIWKALKKRQK